MQVFFTDRAQPVIDNALSVKCKDVEIITVYLDVEPVPFNKGLYSVDITFFFKVTLSAYSSPVVPPATVVGVAAFSKKVILFGSDGNVKVYCSTDPRNGSEHDNTNMPKASVHTVDPKQGGNRKGEAASLQSPPGMCPDDLSSECFSRKNLDILLKSLDIVCDRPPKRFCFTLHS